MLLVMPVQGAVPSQAHSYNSPAASWQMSTNTLLMRLYPGPDLGSRHRVEIIGVWERVRPPAAMEIGWRVVSEDESRNMLLREAGA